MSDSRIAIRYAKPLLSLAQEQGKLDAVKKDMESFLNVCEKERAFALMLENPIIPHLKKAKILELAFKGKVDKITMSLFDIMARKNREAVLREVAVEFLKLYNIQNGIAEAQIVSAVPLDDKLRKQFTQIVEEVSGKKVALKEKVKSDLIGGFVLTIGDRRIDESISGKLRKVRQTLIKS